MVLLAGPALADELVTSVLPTSRSTVLGKSVTVFATAINASGGVLTNCGMELGQDDESSTIVTYNLTDPRTNAVTSGQNAPFNLAAGASQSLVLTIQPKSAQQAAVVKPVASCANGSTGVTSTSIDGVSTILFSASAQATPDVIALVASPTNDGILHIQGEGANAFAVAVANVGSAGTITASVDTGAVTLPLTATICQTDSGGQCIGGPGQTASLSLPANGTASFAVFVQATGELPFFPAGARIFVRLSDSAQAVRGATSVAVTNGAVASATMPKGGIFGVGYPWSTVSQTTTTSTSLTTTVQGPSQPPVRAAAEATPINPGALFLAEDGEVQGLDSVGNIVSGTVSVGSNLFLSGPVLYQSVGSTDASLDNMNGVLSQRSWFSAELTTVSHSTVSDGPAAFWLSGAYQASAYERPSSLNLTSGAWKLRVGNGTLIGTATFAANGTYTGIVSNCAFSGKITLIDTRYDLYHVEFDLPNCPASGLTGQNFTGLAALVDDQSTNDTFLFIGNDTALGGAAVMPFTRN